MSDRRAAPDALAELSRTQLLLQLATLPDLAFESDGFDALSPALQHVTGVIRDALAVDAAGIVLRGPGEVGEVGEAGERGLVPAASAGTPGEALVEVQPLLARVFDGGAPLCLHELDGEGGSSDDSGDAATNGDATHLLRRLGARALMAVPIAVDGEPRGVLYVSDDRARPFGEDDLAFVAVVAGRVGLLLERAELSRAQREIDRQRAQAAARQELLGIVTHELKTPVAVLKAYAELLHGRAEAAGRAEDVDVLTRMEDQADRLLAMVEQVLDLQRIDAGLFPLEVGRVDLAALAERVLDGLRLTSGAVRLEVKAEGDTVVRGDRRRLEQVLTNLAQNAIRFSPPDGAVRVRVSRAERLPEEAGRAQSDMSGDAAGWATVSVSDEGPGVAEHERHQIFRRFYQGQGGDKLHRGHGGLGVGLYIAREIVERHGGAMWLEPPGEGSAGLGATFSFALPEGGPPEE